MITPRDLSLLMKTNIWFCSAYCSTVYLAMYFYYLQKQLRLYRDSTADRLNTRMSAEESKQYLSLVAALKLNKPDDRAYQSALGRVVRLYIVDNIDGDRVSMACVNLDNECAKTDRCAIIVTQRMLDTFSKDQLNALAAHEVGHIVAADLGHSAVIRQSLFYASSTALSAIPLVVLFTRMLDAPFDTELSPTERYHIPLSMMLLMIHYLLRKDAHRREFLADRFCVNHTPPAVHEALMSGIERLEKENGRQEPSVLNRARLWFMGTHPSVDARKAHIAKLTQTMQ